MKKSRAPKKMARAEQEAQWRLDSAIVRGESTEVIDNLRSDLNKMIDKNVGKQILKEYKLDSKNGIARLGPLSDAIKNVAEEKREPFNSLAEWSKIIVKEDEKKISSAQKVEESHEAYLELSNFIIQKK